jgi:hypothetical protein
MSGINAGAARQCFDREEKSFPTQIFRLNTTGETAATTPKRKATVTLILRPIDQADPEFGVLKVPDRAAVG